MSLRPFHLAIPVSDLAKARKFYRDVMGFSEGRSSDLWVDFDFFGHQLVIHYKASDKNEGLPYSDVDGHAVPIPHFGVVLEMSDWMALADNLTAAETKFIIEPYIRFKGQPGEQATMFFFDPCGNALEFKAFEDLSQLFAK